MRAGRAAVALALVAVACGGPEEPPQRETESELARLTLRPEHLPDGLELDEDASGPVSSIRGVLPPPTDAPGLTPLGRATRRAFVSGFKARYVGTGEGTPASVASSAVRFADEAHAATFLDYLRAVQLAPVPGRTSESPAEVPAPGLGEEGYAWHRESIGGETAGCSWRDGDLVLTLTLGGPLGTASAAEALELAQLVGADRAAAG